MVDVKTELMARKNARQERSRTRREAAIPNTVMVEPTKDEYRKTLRHMPSGVGFKETGGARWPMDTFTQRRIREGAVKLIEEAQGQQQRAQHPRQPEAQQQPAPQQAPQQPVGPKPEQPKS